jgi:hypothetical protein
MPDYQRSTTYQDAADVFRGSAAVSVSPFQETPSYQPVGAQVGLTIQRQLEVSEEEVDDAQGTNRVYKDTFLVTFDRYESLNMTIEQILADLLDTFDDVAGDLVEDEEQTVTSGNWGFNDPIVVEHQNGDGSFLTINSVTAGTDGLLVAETDYFVGQDGNGDTVITVIDSATVTTEAQNLVINYDYTPNASVTQDMGAGTELNTFIVRIVAKNDGRQVQYDFWNVQRNAGGETKFAKDDAEDRRNAVQEQWLCRPDYTYHPDGSGGAYACRRTVNAAS